MYKRRQISQKSALQAKEEDLRRLARFVDIEDWENKGKAKLIDDLQCQFIVGTKSRTQ